MCDTFCVRHDDGMLFAKSSDRPVDEPQVVRWFGRRTPSTGGLDTTYLTIPDRGASALLGSQPTWMWGLEHGVNEHGVAVGNEKVWTTDDPRATPPALLGMDLVRLALERGDRADTALETITDLLAAHGQGGSGEQHADEPYWSSFLVVDAHGGWVLETSGQSWVAEPVTTGAAISNRLTVRTGWTRSSPDVEAGDDWDRRRAPDVPTGLADHRLATTRACVRRGTAATAADAVATLRDHGTGPWGAPGRTSGEVRPVPAPGTGDWRDVTVCMHVRGYQRTTASLVTHLPIDPAEPVRAWASLGNACVGVFLPVALLPDRGGRPDTAVVPGVLSDPGAWASFSSLSDRVEEPASGTQALADVRAELDPLEADAWATADELWSARADGAAWAAASARWDAEVRRALARLADG